MKIRYYLITLSRAAPASAYKRGRASLRILTIAVVVSTLLMTVVTHAQRGNSPIYVDQHVVVESLDKIHGVQLTGAVQSGAFLSNTNLLVFTEEWGYRSTAVLEPVKKQNTVKALNGVTTGHSSLGQMVVTSPCGTRRNECVLATKTATACSAINKLRLFNRGLTYQKITKNPAVSGDFISVPVPTSFYNQRSPLEKHNRFFNLPPPVTT